ncbi:hypothetical protein C8J57DRAFT_1503163 [Mycena rebaudengoi]|nr:hypothetical protein C8J57DRAFT_1503163 [Mycena rebaudengoi]
MLSVATLCCIQLGLAPHKTTRTLAGNRGGIGSRQDRALRSGGVPVKDAQVDAGRACLHQVPRAAPHQTITLATPHAALSHRGSAQTCLLSQPPLWLLILATYANIVLRLRGQFCMCGWDVNNCDAPYIIG